jgi:hypothetical protein
MMTKPLENQNQKHVSNNKGPVTTNSLKVFRSNSVFKQLNSEGELSSAPQDEKLEPRGSEESKKSVAYRARESGSESHKDFPSPRFSRTVTDTPDISKRGDALSTHLTFSPGNLIPRSSKK